VLEISLIWTFVVLWIARTATLFLGVANIMATLAEVNDSLAALHADVEALKGRLPGAPAATEADLEAVKASVEAERVNVQSILAS